VAALVWKHGTSKAEARAAILAELKRLGHDGKVSWADFAATARVGPWGTILDARGEITDEVILVEKCGGLVGAAVLRECKVMLGRLFPGGDVI